MSDQPNFESRLAAALQRRADGAPIEVDASAVTRAAATARPSMGVRLFGIPGWRTAAPGAGGRPAGPAGGGEPGHRQPARLAGAGTGLVD